MISNRINAVRKTMKSVSDTKRNQYKQREETKKNDAFFDAYALLVRILQSIKIGKEKADFNISDAMVIEIREILEEVKQIFEKESVSNPYKISQRINELYSRLKFEWEECAKKKLGIRSNIELMKLISDNKNISGIIIELGAITEWPITEKSVERYSKAYERAVQIIKDYNFNDEVREFLRKVQNKSATFRDLTEEVRNWIIEEHLEDKIGLSII